MIGLVTGEIEMPTISVNQDEYDAIMFCKGETEDKAENAEDELYLAEDTLTASMLRAELFIQQRKTIQQVLPRFS